jgi:hypothetical protein
MTQSNIKGCRVLGEGNHLDFIMAFLGWRQGDAEHVSEGRRGERKDDFEDAEVHIVVG